MNEERENRRNFSPEQKYKIVKDVLMKVQTPTDICRKYGISPSLFYKWQDQFLSGAQEGVERGGKKVGVLSSKEQRELESLKNDNIRMKDVIAEITAENIVFKKKNIL